MDRSGRTFAPGGHSHDARLGVARLACLFTEISALGQEIGACRDVPRRVALLRRYLEAQRERMAIFRAHRRASRAAFEALLRAAPRAAAVRAPVDAPGVAREPGRVRNPMGIPPPS